MVRRLIAICPLVWIAIAAAQTPSSYEGLTVTNIRFEPLEQPLEPRELHDILPLRMNQPLRMPEVRASIERLFATGRYADIRVDAEPYNGGVAILFATRAGWFVGAVATAGRIASPPDAGQLENAAGLNLGEPYTEAKLKRALSDQQRLLEANGLFLSEMHPIFDWETTGRYQQVNLRFAVADGPRARFATPVLVGDLKLDQQRILHATRFRRWLVHSWKPMTQTRMRGALDGVRALYAKENRLEAKVSLESVRYDAATNRAIPTLRIEAGPRIQVNPVGDKLSVKILRRYIPIFEEHAVDRDLLAEGAGNLRDYLQSQGYFEADVEFKQQAVINDRANIDYLINTGRRHRLVHIGIEGNHYFTTQAIRERMFLQARKALEFPHGRFSENLLRRDRETIASLYQSNGFRDVKIAQRVVDGFLGKAGDLAVYLEIDEGPQYFIGHLQVDGVEHLAPAALLPKLSSIAGQPFSEFNVAVDRDAILAQCAEKGFPNATFEWSSTPAETPHRLDLRYEIHEGRQQFVRQVVVSGNRVTRAGLINRNISLNPGDPLSPSQMTAIQRRLYDLGVFSRVDTAIQDPDSDTNSKYILYNLEEARRTSVAVGFGAELGRIGGCQTCYDAPAGSTGFSPRVSFDVTRNNLWGIAHSISLRTRVSTLQDLALLNYSWPRFGGHDNLTVSFTALFNDSRSIQTFNSRRAEVSAQVNQRLSKSINLFYRFAYRDVGLSHLKITPFLIQLLSQPVRVGISSVNFVQDRRDNALDPHKGVYNTLDLGLADSAFGSQRNFMRLLARNSTYHALGRKLVLARNTEFGEIFTFNWSGNPLDAVPLPERFFSGGAGSDRGFPEYQAGPRDLSTGFPLGGTALLFNQTELRFPLIGDTLGGVLFHDMGNVYSSLGNLSVGVKQPSLKDFDYMVHAVGFGMRYRTPVGPVRVDLAYSINSPRFFGFSGTQQDLVNAGVTPCTPPAGVANHCVMQRVSHFQFFFSLGQTF